MITNQRDIALVLGTLEDTLLAIWMVRVVMGLVHRCYYLGNVDDRRFFHAGLVEKPVVIPPSANGEGWDFAEETSAKDVIVYPSTDVKVSLFGNPRP